MHGYTSIRTSMILAHLTDTTAFAHLPWWNLVLTFLGGHDLTTLDAGRHDIDGDRLYAIVADDTARDVVNPLEAHRAYIDVQLAVTGSFPVLWRPLETCTMLRSDYVADSDIILYDDMPSSLVLLEPGTALVLHPNDAHAPQPPDVAVRKIVFKVSVEL